jgi:hypothetical protein
MNVDLQQHFIAYCRSKEVHVVVVYCSEMGKYVYTGVVSRQRLGKHVPAATKRIQSRYCCAITMEIVFSMWFVLNCYKQSQSSSSGAPLWRRVRIPPP